MPDNFDALKSEIIHYLESNAFAIFHGHSRTDETNFVYWQTEEHPDYQAFLKTAEAVGIRLIVLHTKEFSEGLIEDVLDEIEQLELGREERREMQQRLEAMRRYEGQTCEIELSFTYEGQVYLFDLETPWFEEYNELADEISLMTSPLEEDDGPIGGFYSNN
jgi:hypothetical protein